ncbi:efflux RND transporter periplasmic adaptor subunit [Pigmentiphaga aceris]|uniref:Efflux RND transporter periplasmic adaptor subunit n=1 Tax=Pigmentiphaga aceris TaxID=1940612 RepID=A0A5C0AVE0_9BURK|nr:efflux RND transporter periplasmic adaptor subunit [Pigmentiphaga aceris]QEI06389.1 efflux RND transporter periplasmic adaptor subunit [Pigmentiphaga aceris]
MKTSHKYSLAIGLALTSATLAYALAMENPEPVEAEVPAVVQPALTVATATLQAASFPVRVSANGNLMAWQEASIGAEANNLRLNEVKVNVGDKVRRGQVLASFAAATVDAELAQSRATVTEAEVALSEAAANAERGRMLQETGALAGQQIQQYAFAERTARARLDAAKAAEKTQQLRLAQTRILAPDDGVISARTATVGAVVPAGQELFRLIRGGRLEWRAEVAAADLAKLKPGQIVWVTPTGGDPIEGRLRVLAPVTDIQTRNGLAYVDLPANETARAGMFARGEFQLGNTEVMSLPQRAVQIREGFSYVMRVGPDSRVIQTKVISGRRSGDRIEILAGLEANHRVVVSGAAFIGQGDLVRVNEEGKTERAIELSTTGHRAAQ